MNKYLSASMLALALVSTAAPAFAQRGPGGARGEVNDDRRDARQFAALTQQFEQAVSANNPQGIQSAIQQFIQAGRAEVAELQAEARRARWTGVNHGAEMRRMQQAQTLVQQLERSSRGVQWRANPRAVEQARQAMNGFNRLALNELHASMRTAMAGPGGR